MISKRSTSGQPARALPHGRGSDRTRALPHGRGSDRARTLRRNLLKWYDANRRDLPWRRTRDPYHVWLSEIMLQQTRVQAVIPYFERFLAQFPSIRSLAEAPLDSVLKLWAGLGYYSRARNLHAAAQVLARDHAATFPASPEALGKLPGIGRYTAAAIASIAFDHPAAVLDGNVQRVLARMFVFKEPLKTSQATQQLWRLAEQTLDHKRPGDFNQAMMELGATICLPQSPRCELCPVRTSCAAAAAGIQEQLPIMPPKARVPTVHARAVAAWRGGRILWVQRPEHGLLGGLWELPGTPATPERTARAQIAQAISNHFGLLITAGRSLGQIEHVFTHRRLLLDVCAATVVGPASLSLKRHSAARWCTPDEVDQLPLSTLDQKTWALALTGHAHDASAPRRGQFTLSGARQRTIA